MEPFKIETLGDMLKVLQSLTEEQLKQKARILSEDQGIISITELTEEDEDFLINKDDDEDVGTESELKEIHGDDFKLENYEIIEQKGLLTFYAE